TAGDGTPARRTWRLDVVATDALGNASIAASAFVIKDELAPSLPNNIRTVAARDRVTLSWDDGSSDVAGDDGSLSYLVSYGVVARADSGDPACPFGAPGDAQPDGASFAVEGNSPVAVTARTATLSGILPGTDLFLYVAGVDAVGNVGCFAGPVLARPDVVTFVAGAASAIDGLAGTVATATIDGVTAYAAGSAGLVIVDRAGAAHTVAGNASDVVAFGDQFLVARGDLGVSLVPVDASGAPGAPVDKSVGAASAVAQRPGRALLASSAGVAALDPSTSASPVFVGPSSVDAPSSLLNAGALVVVVRGDGATASSVSVRARSGLAEVGALAGLPLVTAARVVDGDLWLALGLQGVRRVSLACPGAACLSTLASRALPDGASALDLLPFDDAVLVAAHVVDAGGDSVFALDASLRTDGRAALAVGASVHKLIARGSGFCAVVSNAGAGDGLACFDAIGFPVVDREVRFATSGAVGRVVVAGAHAFLLEAPTDTAAAAVTEVRLGDGAVVHRTSLGATALTAVAALDGIGALVLDADGGLTLVDDAGAHAVGAIGASVRSEVPLH
ncbi:MAG TPA: hypothetical protein VGO62_14235, partial [Myxococcota bacterium]